MTDAITLGKEFETGYKYFSLTASDETKETPTGTGPDAVEGFEAEHDHHNPEVSNTLKGYFVRDM